MNNTADNTEYTIYRVPTSGSWQGGGMWRGYIEFVTERFYGTIQDRGEADTPPEKVYPREIVGAVSERRAR